MDCPFKSDAFSAINVNSHSAFQEALHAAQEQLSQQKEVILGQEREIKGKTGEANHLRGQNNDAQLKIKELEHNISKHKKDSADATAKVRGRSLDPKILRD